MIKLSELNDDVEVSFDESNYRYTVAELKREIIELGEPHHERRDWYTTKDATWTPDAESMIEDYIDSCRDDMYDDWDERAKDCVDKVVVEKIQALLNDMFIGARDYWEYDKKVEIDIFPPDGGLSAEKGADK